MIIKRTYDSFFYAILRDLPADMVTLVITDEASREETIIGSTPVTDLGWYQQIELDCFQFNENGTYRLEIYDTNNIGGKSIAGLLYRDLLFFTNDSNAVNNKGKYDIDAGEYTTHETNNDYIILK